MALIDGLISHWKLDETSGQRNDSHGVNHLTDNATVTSAVGKIGTAGQFTATNLEYLSITDNVALSMGDIDFTIGFWVKFDTLPSVNGHFRTLVSKYHTSANTREYMIAVQRVLGVNELGFYVSSDGTTPISVTSSVIPVTGVWYYVVAYHDANSNVIGIQVNDGSVVTAAHSTGVLNSSSSFMLGSRSNPTSNAYHDGQLDSVSIWKRILTEGERTFLYNNGHGRDYPFEFSNLLNFAVANVSTLYSANAGVIDLSTNHGLKLPSAVKPFYAVWWNYTDYPDPTDDPNREVVKVYKKINDKLFIQRGCQRTVPSDKNLIGKTYRIAQFLDEDKFNKQLNYFKNPQQFGYYFNDFEHATTFTASSFDSFIRMGSNGATTPITTFKDKVGVMALESGDTGTSSQGYGLGNTSFLVLGSMDYEFTANFLFPSVGPLFNFFCGFANGLVNSTAISPSSCVGFGYGFTNTLGTRGWRILIRDSSTTLFSEISPVSVKADTWYELKIKTKKENIVEFYINKTLIKRLEGTMILTTVMTPCFGISEIPGGASESVYIDFFEFKANFRNERTASVLNS